NWELSQMTKWGMPGVYTHAFMDGWSPGYLGSVAYNHNGMMRMYETQSGREATPPATPTDSAAPGGRGGRGGGRGGGSTAAGAKGGGGRGGGGGAGGPAGGGDNPFAALGGGAGRAGFGGGRAAVPTGRGGGQSREWYRGIPIPPNAVQNFTRRNNTNYMETGVLSALQLTSMFPNLVLENFYTKTKNAMDAGANQAPYGYVIPVQ